MCRNPAGIQSTYVKSWLWELLGTSISWLEFFQKKVVCKLAGLLSDLSQYWLHFWPLGGGDCCFINTIKRTILVGLLELCLRGDRTVVTVFFLLKPTKKTFLKTKKPSKTAKTHVLVTFEGKRRRKQLFYSSWVWFLNFTLKLETHSSWFIAVIKLWIMKWINILVTVIKQTLKKAQEKYGTIEYSKILDTVFFGIQWKCYGLELQKEWKYHVSPCILHSLSKDEIGWL